MARIEGYAKGLGLVITLVFLLFPGIPQEVQFALVALILVLVGIPHGGIDHLIHNPQIGSAGLFRFIIRYLLLMLAYGLIWWLLPLAALLAFLGMSAYHFGQSHFIGRPQHAKLDGLLFVCKGSFFLAVILFGNWQETLTILKPITTINLDPNQRLIVLGLLLVATLGTQLLKKDSLRWGDALDYLVLAPLLFFNPLLISFIVYFGFWHSLPSMLAEYAYLKTIPAFDSPAKFGKQLLPFSVISLVGIGALLVLGLEFLDKSELYLLFFILISLISLPHILYMDTFLKGKAQN
jgi:Brp/Blh family beta-carotene 15,15'-monooxygenase